MLLNVLEVKTEYPLIYDELCSLFNSKYSKFPCMFAKSSFNLNFMNIGIYDFFFDNVAIKKLSEDLKKMSLEMNSNKKKSDNEERFSTFIAIFKNSSIQSTEHFQSEFFKLMENLNQQDPIKWPKNACKNPEDFSFSFYFNGDIWFPVSVSPFHKYCIRKASYIIIAFQPGKTFDLNKTKYKKKFSLMRSSIHKKISFIYNDDIPTYLTSKSEGKNYVQYIGDDPKLENPQYICPLKIL